MSAFDVGAERVFVEVVGNLAVDKIGDLLASCQVVHHHDVGDAAPIERRHQVRADEAGPAGNEYHGDGPPVPSSASSSARVATAVPSRATTSPAAVLARSRVNP